MRRFVFMILDGVGAGALPDAGEYGDAGSDTLGNLSRTVDLRLPFFARLGLGNILPVMGVPPVAEPLSMPGRLAPLSGGKDTTVGHWEHMGLVTAQPFPTYPQGFPEEIMGPFIRRIGRGILGNKPASGTAIIAELGGEHLASGKPIVYTSADSVFQIAAHVDVVPLDQLYEWCRIARGLLQGRHGVARVIARPFTGTPDAFARTADRRDFSLEPPGPTYLDMLGQNGVPVLALGKISEIFGGRGVTAKVKVGSNAENLALVLDLLRERGPQAMFDRGLLLTNLVDFDMVWGHRNDVDGFARGLEAVDAALPGIVGALGPEDRLLVTADHGVDPTTSSTDHSREYVPLLLYPRPPGAPAAVYEGMFADTGATVLEYLTGKQPGLEGRVVRRFRPVRGWRRYTPVQISPLGSGGGRRGGVAGRRVLAGRVGFEEAHAAARWLSDRLGAAPQAAVVLGSGLRVASGAATLSEVAYGDVPHWRAGSVSGHPGKMTLQRWLGWRVAILKGRLHEYEGYDLSEVQLQARTLAAWGVRNLVLTTAAGGVAPEAAPGEVWPAERVLDLQYTRANGKPSVLTASPGGAPGRPFSRLGIHASVPGPQYETPAELEVLRGLGAATVSMSPAAELRAAYDEGLNVAVLAVVANTGDTTHEDVLASGGRAVHDLTAAVEGLLRAWGAPGLE